MSPVVSPRPDQDPFKRARDLMKEVDKHIQKIERGRTPVKPLPTRSPSPTSPVPPPKYGKAPLPQLPMHPIKAPTPYHAKPVVPPQPKENKHWWDGLMRFVKRERPAAAMHQAKGLEKLPEAPPKSAPRPHAPVSPQLRQLAGAAALPPKPVIPRKPPVPTQRQPVLVFPTQQQPAVAIRKPSPSPHREREVMRVPVVKIELPAEVEKPVVKHPTSVPLIRLRRASQAEVRTLVDRMIRTSAWGQEALDVSLEILRKSGAAVLKEHSAAQLKSAVNALKGEMLRRGLSWEKSCHLVERELQHRSQERHTAMGIRRFSTNELQHVMFDNRLSKGPGRFHTVIVTREGESFELINTLNPGDRNALLAQEGIVRNGKLVFGEGSFGKVRLARNIRTGELVAVKKVKKQPSLAIEEAELGTQVGNAHNIGTVGTAIAIDSKGRKTLYQFLPLASRGDGKSFLQSTRPLPAQHALLLRTRYFHDSLLGLRDAHANGVSHLDYKPANTMLTRHGDTRLVDWGLSAETPIGPNGELFGRIQSGTPLYMSPEIYSFETHDLRKSDAWAIGRCILESFGIGHPCERDLEQALRGQVSGAAYAARLRNTAMQQFRAQFPGINSPARLDGNSLLEIGFKLADPNPTTRLTPTQALGLPYFQNPEHFAAREQMLAVVRV